jgi:hypothetical protein
MADRSVVVDTSKSPHAKLRSIPISAVKLRDRFWQPRLIALQEVTIPTQYELMEQTGRIDNFRRVAGKVGGEFRGFISTTAMFTSGWKQRRGLSLSNRTRKLPT